MATGKINNPLAVTKNIMLRDAGNNPTLIQLISGRIVTLLIQGSGFNVATGSKVKIATLTDGIPALSAFAICALNAGSTNKYALFEVTASGEIYVYNYTGTLATFLFGTVTYLVE